MVNESVGCLVWSKKGRWFGCSYLQTCYEYCAFDFFFPRGACNLNKFITSKLHLSINIQPLLRDSVIICSHFQRASVCTGRRTQRYHIALSHCIPFCGRYALLNMSSSSVALEIGTFRVLQRSNNSGKWPCVLSMYFLTFRSIHGKSTQPPIQWVPAHFPRG